jgi:hypothetical protein
MILVSSVAFTFTGFLLTLHCNIYHVFRTKTLITYVLSDARVWDAQDEPGDAAGVWLRLPHHLILLLLDIHEDEAPRVHDVVVVLWGRHGWMDGHCFECMCAVLPSVRANVI